MGRYSLENDNICVKVLARPSPCNLLVDGCSHVKQELDKKNVCQIVIYIYIFSTSEPKFTVDRMIPQVRGGDWEGSWP